MRNWMLDIAIIVSWIICGLIGWGVAMVNHPHMLDTEYKYCMEELDAYKEALADPHHCVSIVVETLEGKDDRKLEK